MTNDAQYTLRLPKQLLEKIAKAAEAKGRSTAWEFIRRLESTFKGK